MRRDVQGIVLLLVGVMVLRLAVGEQFLFYVAEGMRPWLVVAAVVLVGLGGLTLWDAYTDDDHGHAGPRIAYLLLLPVLAVFVVAPSALGAFSAERSTPSAPPATADLPPLADDPAEIPLREFVIRAVWDAGRTLRGREVTMTGFVTPDPAGGWWLSRMSMACCAADAQASRIKVVGASELPADTWVTVSGRWVEGGGLADPDAVPLLEPTDVAAVSRPRNPYE